MNKCIKSLAVSILAMTFSVASYADEAAIRQAMTKSMPSVKIGSVKPAVVKGLLKL